MSVSALDLFASALGVFIILTSVSLPFIFNTSQSTAKNLLQAELEAEIKSTSNTDEAVEKLIKIIMALKIEVEELKKTADEIEEYEKAKTLTSKVEQLEQALKNTEKTLEATLQERKKTEMIPPIDIVIALDTTGSMTDELRSLQGGVIYLSRILMKWSESPAVGIIEIMDQCDYSRRKKFALQEINSTSLKNLQQFVYSMGRMNTSCNIDMEEGIHLALREALTVNWRDDVNKRVIILMSDFPPYRHMLNEVQRSITNFTSKKNQTVSIVHPVNAYSTNEHVSIMKNLARLGKGQYIDGAGSIIGAIILAL
jgi:Mg-chelatase subunit ChlD